jgi:UDP:flavonoid glycosyltransferase YjiC (YdhE family)
MGQAAARYHRSVRPMRVLVVSIPGAGHLNPVLPLVEALLTQGDRVVVAAGIDPAGVVAGSGAEFRQAGHSETDWFETFRSRVRGFPGDGLPPARINHYFLPRLFGEIAAPDMIDDVLACGRELRPDVLVFETSAFAGPLAAEILGVPGVHHLISPMLPREVMELANDAVCPLWRSFGCDAPVLGGMYRGITIAVAPPSLEAETLPSGECLPMLSVPPPRPALESSRRPLVYATLGTFFGMNIDVLRAVLDGLAEEDLDVVMTVGSEQNPAGLDPVPANARVERFIPQAELLPRCAAVVHHGGSGTTLGSLAHGIPQVVIPQGADNFINGDLLSAAGVARSLLPADVSATAVRDAVRAILGDPSYAASARRLAREMGALLSPSDVARMLRDRVLGEGTRARP